MDDGSCFARERGTSRFPTPPGFFRLSCLLLGSIRQEQRQARRVAFWESARVIHQLLGTVHSDLLQLIVDRVQPPPPRARKTSGGLPPGTASLSMATSTSTASGGLTPGTASVATASSPGSSLRRATTSSTTSTERCAQRAIEPSRGARAIAC